MSVWIKISKESAQTFSPPTPEIPFNTAEQSDVCDHSLYWIEMSIA